MPEAVEEFGKGLWKQCHRLPVWLPGVDLSVGDIGVIEDDQWVFKGKLQNLEPPINFVLHVDDTPAKSLVIDSSSGVSSTVNVSGDVPPLDGVVDGNASVGIAFTGEGQFSLRLSNLRSNYIEDLDRVEKEMMQRFLSPNPTWQEEWIVVTEVTTADSGLVAVAAGNSAKVNVDLGLKLGDPGVVGGAIGVDASVGHQANMAAAHLVSSGEAVMFSGRRVRTRILHAPDVGDARLDLTVDGPSEVAVWSVDEVAPANK